MKSAFIFFSYYKFVLFNFNWAFTAAWQMFSPCWLHHTIYRVVLLPSASLDPHPLPLVHLCPPHSSLQVICLPLHQRGGHTKHKFPHLLSSNSYLTSLLWDSLCPHFIPPHQHLHPSLSMCFLPSSLPLIESHFLPTSPTLFFLVIFLLLVKNIKG